MKKSEYLRFRVDGATYDALIRHCADHGKNVSEVLRRSLARELAAGGNVPTLAAGGNVPTLAAGGNVPTTDFSPGHNSSARKGSARRAGGGDLHSCAQSLAHVLTGAGDSFSCRVNPDHPDERISDVADLLETLVRALSVIRKRTFSDHSIASLEHGMATPFDGRESRTSLAE
jgi:hypothetical protein